jgi:signal peptidase I
MAVISSILEFIKTVAIIVVIAFLVRFFLIQPFVVEGQSMEPNFHDREYLLVNKLVYRLHKPQRGDVIVFHPPSRPDINYIKRIIALPGDTVDIQDDKILVNGVQIDEPYLGGNKTLIQNSPVAHLKETLGQDMYFVLGDNREHSSDSREIGDIPAANIIGKAWIVVFPQKYFGLVHHPTYSPIPQSN